ncbi:hypothetical protein [Aminobacter aminovorans]|uniref:Uncharacterized protein n=1 Tax=Aminobacter aminovorans TaxID=83263 RepID=A0AAC8YNB4_AMIAI|nr:hypothetical protein [Aminobacter aminovorans]AMS41184.1 hypothetical protein AA2016_2256 [Aminobacter aminovorans]MBB3705833.1 hypothetical protein [Aminobacter aminovorans]
MVGGRTSTVVFYAACIIFGIVFAFLVMDWYFDAADLCGKGESTGECVREWFGAWSGYIAAAAAGITLFALYDQIKEQRKQTEFTVGDTLPAMNVVPDLDDVEQIVVRVVNWNRRGVIFLGMNVNGLGPAAKHSVMELKMDGRTVPDWGNPYLRGWENRQESPPVAQFKVAATVDEKLVRKWPDKTSVDVYLQIIDTKHRNEKLTGWLHPEGADHGEAH